MLKIFDGILEILFPRKCIVCGRPDEKYLCVDCFSLIDIAYQSFCPFCEKISLNGETCPSCKKEHFLDGLIFASDYNQVVLQRTIHCFKYPPYLVDLKNVLSFLIISYIKLSHNNFFKFFNNFILVPVPSHKSAVKKRGFDHTKELTKTLSEILGLNKSLDLIIKKKKTLPQVKLTREERLKNPLGAFELNKNLNFSVLGKNFLIVDDVFTTGATMDEIAKLLKKNGAKKVWGLCIGREFKTNYSK